MIWLFLALAIAGVIGSINVRKYYRLSKFGIQGTGLVTEVTASYHDTIRYQYTVNTVTYAGQTQSDIPNPPASKLHVGDSIAVFFDPIAPSISVISSPTALLKNELKSIVPAVFLVPTIIVFVLYKRHTAKRGSPSK